MIEKTFVMVKPDSVVRGLIGEVVSRIERKGLKLIGMRMIRMTEGEAKALYAVHEGKPFFNDLIAFIRSAPVVVMAIEGESAVAVVRRLIGPTDAKEALPGTVRGDLSCSKSMNVVHASDSVENAERELTIFFDLSDLVAYKRLDENWACWGDAQSQRSAPNMPILGNGQPIDPIWSYWPAPMGGIESKVPPED